MKNVFFNILLGTLGASLLGNLLTGKGVMTAAEGAIETSERWGTKLELVRTFDASSFFNKSWNTKVLSIMNLSLMVFIKEIIYLK